MQKRNKKKDITTEAGNIGMVCDNEIYETRLVELHGRDSVVCGRIVIHNLDCLAMAI
jgi:hypothetical protein